MHETKSGLKVVLLGLLALGAVLTGTWFLLDTESEVHTGKKALAAKHGRKDGNRTGTRPPLRTVAPATVTDAAAADAPDETPKPTSEPKTDSASASPRPSASPRAPMGSTKDLIVAAAKDEAGADKGPNPEAGPTVKAAPSAKEAAPTPGTLKVTVINADTKAAIGSAEVYAPLPLDRIEVDGAFAKVPPAFAPYRKVATASGEAVFTGKDLARGSESETPSGNALVLATSVNMVPGAAKIDLGKVLKSGATITVSLAPAVEITGVVADPKGARIPNARVELIQGDLIDGVTSTAASFRRGATAAFEAVCNPQGEFRIAVARNFSYVVTASADGFAPYTSKTFDFRRDEKKLSIILKHGRSLEGFVYHEGQPVPGADVESLTDGTKAKTGADGKFYISALADRIYSNRVTLRVTKKGLGPVIRDELVNSSDIRFDLVKASTLSGVVMLDGAPAVGATITASFRQGDRDWPVANVRSVAEGKFTIPDLGEGSVKLRATGSNDKVSSSRTVQIRSGEAKDGVVLELQDSAVIRGRVTTTGPSGQTVGVAGAKIQRNGRDVTATDGAGNFTIKGLGDDSSLIGIVNRGKLPEHLEKLALFTVNGTNFFTLPEPKRVNTNPGGEYEVLFEVVPFFDDEVRSVTLALSLNSGGNAEDVLLEVTPKISVAPGGSKVSPVSELTDIVSGTANVRLLLVTGVDYTAKITHPRIQTKNISTAQLKAIPDQGTLTVTLASTMAVVGYVRDSAGNAIPDADCTVLSGGTVITTAKTDQHGFFDLGGLSGKDYTLNIFRHSYYLSSQKVRPSSHSPAPIDVVLLAANEIRLLVTTANGSPQPGARIRISRPAGTSATAPIEYFDLGETDGQGRKITNFHWIRNYQVVATRGNAEIGFVNFDNKTTENTRDFTLVLEPASLISGQVVSETSGQRVSDVDVYARLDGASGARAGNSFWTRANAGGEFSVMVPLNGRYTMCVRESRAYAASNTTSAMPGDQAVRVTVPPKDNVQGNWAEVVAIDAPSGLTAGQQFTARITVRNRGTTTWTASEGYALGSQSPQDNGRWGLGRIAVPQGETVLPGMTHVFTATLTAPAAGLHAMQWRMVQERREWFGEFSAALNIHVAQPR